MNKVELVIQALGIKKYKVKGDQYIFSCPFAPWTHSGGVDKHPSFGMRVTDDGRNFVFNCFACGRSGNAYTFYEMMKEFGIDLSFLLVEDEGVARFKALKEFEEIYFNGNGNGWKVEEPAELPEAEKERLRKVIYKYSKFLEERRITKETAKEWVLGYDSSVNAVVFPVFRRDGRVVGWSKRFVKSGRYRHSVGFPRDKVLYGENKINEANGAVVLVEGFFDVLRVYQAGYVALGIMGTELSEAQFVRLVNMFPKDAKLVVMMDGDLAGYTSAKKIVKRFKDILPVVKVDVPQGKDPADLKEDEIKKIIETAL